MPEELDPELMTRDQAFEWASLDEKQLLRPLLALSNSEPAATVSVSVTLPILCEGMEDPKKHLAVEPSLPLPFVVQRRQRQLFYGELRDGELHLSAIEPESFTWWTSYDDKKAGTSCRGRANLITHQ